MIKLITLDKYFTETIKTELEGNTETYESIVSKIESNDYVLVTDTIARQSLIDNVYPVEILKIQGIELFESITGLEEGWIIAYEP